ncbi:hypothetical protein B7P43_G08767 [Cryptotermes secundus]|uniref:Uncharacterized protein n=1 Tax=Cryptotermes secundus TaxID=105785 RepID=A0A2J7R2V2_9NEOP|nr:hypothetical protein B7P43_G08767 [Cryptotermes secundus]
MSLKCRKCRQVLLTQHDAVLTAHGEHIGANAACAAVQFGAVFYLQEDRLPAWIETIVDKVIFSMKFSYFCAAECSDYGLLDGDTAILQVMRAQSKHLLLPPTPYLPPEGWVKGRLHCPKCQGRVGAFDFVSGQKCACGLCLLPAVHLIRSKVDQEACVVPQERE